MNTRTAHVTRTKLAATAAVLGCAALVLAGCGGSGSDVDGSYFAVSEGQHGDVVVLKGDQITYVDVEAWHSAGSEPHGCDSIETVLDDPAAAAEKGEVEDSYEVRGSGTINESRTSVDWLEEGGSTVETGTISFADDRATMEFVFSNGVDDVVLVPVESDRGEDVLAEYCG